MSDPQEIERLRRLRDRQIQARDPLKKQRRLQHHIARRRRASRRRFSFGEIFRDVPAKITGTLIGMAAGVLLLVILPEFVETALADQIGLAALAVLAILGFFFGRAIDVRNALSDF